ncbi:MAG: tyrosine recombinase XerC [Clostridiales bacterium]|nr:tyrosine recombinase XerC [Clostridiales bacterium]
MAFELKELPIFARDYLAYMDTVRNCSENTIREYFYDLRLFLKFIKRQKSGLKIPIEDITIEEENLSMLDEIILSDLYSYMTFLNRERGMSSRSRARKVASLKSFYKYLFSKAKVIKSNPTIELESPKLAKELPRYLSLEESKRLLASIDGRYHERDFAIVIIFLNCGLRISELVSININHIRDNNTLVIRGKGNKDRTIYLNTACLYAINRYISVRPKASYEDPNALFVSMRGSRMSRKTIHVMLKKYFLKAGLDAEKYSAHKLRHTAATLMYRHGHVDIRALQSILGHKSIATTEIYTHVDNEKIREAINANPLSEVKHEN